MKSYFCAMHLVDTHTHLYSEQFDEDRKERIEKAMELGVKEFYLPNIDSSSISGMLQLQRDFPNNCFPMMGLHPCSVAENFEEELAIVKKELDERNYLAIGEIGIDLYWEKKYLAQQEIAFRRQIQWAKEKNLPIVIHCRESFDEILAILDELNDEKLSGIFHCFTGSLEQARHILSYGDFKLGIGGVVTFKNSGLDKVVQELSLEDLVLETDSPYLAPHPYRGKRNESAHLLPIAEKLCDIFGIGLEDLARQTTVNAHQIFKTQEWSSQKF